MAVKGLKKRKRKSVIHSVWNDFQSTFSIHMFIIILFFFPSDKLANKPRRGAKAAVVSWHGYRGKNTEK